METPIKYLTVEFGNKEIIVWYLCTDHLCQEGEQREKFMDMIIYSEEFEKYRVNGIHHRMLKFKLNDEDFLDKFANDETIFYLKSKVINNDTTTSLSGK